MDGQAYAPRNYEEQETDSVRFASRADREIGRLRAGYDHGWIAAAWEAYWDGIYGICLKNASPENIVRKSWLIDRISILAERAEADESLCGELRDAVDQLDLLERSFCEFDRAIAGRPLSRDTYIDAVRLRFPAIRSSGRVV